MSKARYVIDVMNSLQELAGDPVRSASDLKSGQNVIFKQGHPNAGLLGIIIGPTPGEAEKVDLKIGKQTSVGIPVADLLLVTSPGSGIGAPQGKGDSGAAVGSPVGKVVPNAGDAGRYGANGSPSPYAHV